MYVHINPFEGVAESALTSNVIDFRDAYMWSASIYTSAGTTDNLKLQFSNSSAEPPSSAAEASFRAYVTYSAATLVRNIEGYRYARFVRDASTASWVVDIAKQVYA